jgi:hypothetical protein
VHSQGQARRGGKNISSTTSLIYLKIIIRKYLVRFIDTNFIHSIIQECIWFCPFMGFSQFWCFSHPVIMGCA